MDGEDIRRPVYQRDSFSDVWRAFETLRRDHFFMARRIGNLDRDIARLNEFNDELEKSLGKLNNRNMQLEKIIKGMEKDKAIHQLELNLARRRLTQLSATVGNKIET